MARGFAETINRLYTESEPPKDILGLGSVASLIGPTQGPMTGRPPKGVAVSDRSCCIRRALIVGMGLSALAGLWMAGPPAPQAIAAPPEDPATWKGMLEGPQVKAVLDYYNGRLDVYTRASGLFMRDVKSVAHIGRSVAVLGNVGAARHRNGKEFYYAALREAGLNLAQAATDKDFDKAKQAAEFLKRFPTKGEFAKEPKVLPWNDELYPLKELMMSLDRLKPEIDKANQLKDKEFAAAAPGLAAECRTVAFLATAIGSHPDFADEGWTKYCDMLAKASLDTAQAYENRDKNGAANGITAANKVCTDCHADYR